MEDNNTNSITEDNNVVDREELNNERKNNITLKSQKGISDKEKKKKIKQNY